MMRVPVAQTEEDEEEEEEEDDDDDTPCSVCGGKDSPDDNAMLLCDAECGRGTHLACCSPPLHAVPDGDWFCAECTSLGIGKTAALI